MIHQFDFNSEVTIYEVSRPSLRVKSHARHCAWNLTPVTARQFLWI